MNVWNRLELTAVNTAELDSQSATVTLRTMPVGPPHVPVVRVSQVTQTTADIAWEAGKSSSQSRYH